MAKWLKCGEDSTCCNIWYGLMAATFTFSLLAGLATLAHEQVLTMDSRVGEAALTLMAQRDLNSVCINGSKTLMDGAVAHAANAGEGQIPPRPQAFFSVCSNHKGHLNFSGYRIPPEVPKEPETLGFGTMSHLQLLTECGGVLGYYTTTDISGLIQARPDGNWGGLHQLNGLRPKPWPTDLPELQDLFWSGETKGADPWHPAQRCHPYSTGNASYFVAVNASVANAASRVAASRDLYVGVSTASPLLEGTLQLSAQVLACESTMFLHLRQTPAVAACVARKYYGSDASTTCPMYWLLALGWYEQYTCTHHVVTTALPTFSGILDVAKNVHTVAFTTALPGQTYDDMMAVYTGALGALFGAVAAIIAAVVALALASCCCCPCPS
jgi:hypothetical protein